MTSNRSSQPKHWVTALFLLPTSFLVFQLLNGSYLIHRAAGFVWLIVAVFLVSFFVAGLLWARYVPVGVSIGFAVTAWIIAIIALLCEL